MRMLILVAPIAVFFAAQGCGSSKGSGSSGNGGAGAGGGAVAGATGLAGASGAAGSAAGAPGSSGAAGTSGGSGGAIGACGDGMGPDSGDSCNTATASGPCVVAQVSTATAPTPAGGAIVAGTYNLTSETVYGAASGGAQPGSRRETLVVSSVAAGSFTLDQVHVSGSMIDRSHGTVVRAGTMVTYTPTCPPPGDGGDNGGSANYSATPTTFTLIQPKNGSTDVKVYTRS